MIEIPAIVGDMKIHMRIIGGASKPFGHDGNHRPSFSVDTDAEINVIQQTGIVIKYGHETFENAAKSFKWHQENILNFFDNRTTNASVESFNARIKLFRTNQKGVKDTTFFLFRLTKLNA